jgi:hypothetical protein
MRPKEIYAVIDSSDDGLVDLADASIPSVLERAGVPDEQADGSMRVMASFAGILCGLCASCATVGRPVTCELSDAELSLLKPRVISFLEARHIDTRCESLSSTTDRLPSGACAIYGGPKSSAACPDALDGDYWVTFRRKVLAPVQLIPIAR